VEEERGRSSGKNSAKKGTLSAKKSEGKPKSVTKSEIKVSPVKSVAKPTPKNTASKQTKVDGIVKPIAEFEPIPT
jgi:hypothetical protein